MKILIKRAYEPASTDDGYRVLVDRLWPRGIKKEDLKLDSWHKEIAPSTELREWFGHDPAKFDEFQRRYQKELDVNDAFVKLREELKGKPTVTLVYGAKDEQHNQAVVLQHYLQKHS